MPFDGLNALGFSRQPGSIPQGIPTLDSSVTVNAAAIGAWLFGGTVFDASRYGQTLTLQNNPTWTPGPLGNALSSNGVNQYATTPINKNVSTALSSLTLSCWVRPSSLSSTYSTIFSTTSVNFVLFYHSGAGLGAQINGTINLTSSVTLPLGVWSHVALVYTGTNALIYVNGVLSNYSLSKTGSVNLGAAAYISTWTTLARAFQGSIANVFLVAQALLPSQIATLYAQPFYPTIFPTDRVPLWVPASGSSPASGAGTAAGSSSASGIGASIASGTGSAAGSSTASGSGVVLVSATGSAAGSSTAVGVSVGAGTGIGTATGSSTATGVGATVAKSAGSASGASTATGHSNNPHPVIGISLGSKLPVSLPLLGSNLPAFAEQVRSMYQRIANANNNPDFGPTTARPTTSLAVGQDFFDTTLGYKVAWNGTVWVDGSGVIR